MAEKFQQAKFRMRSQVKFNLHFLAAQFDWGRLTNNMQHDNIQQNWNIVWLEW